MFDQKELGRRLQEARKARQLTQENVASELGISRSALAKIESGKRSVSGIELRDLAFLYGQGMDALLNSAAPADEPVAAFFRANPDWRDSDKLALAIRRSIQVGRELHQLETALDIPRDPGLVARHDLRAPNGKWPAIEQGRRLAEQERKRLDLGDAPIANVAELLESQGIRTAQLDLPQNVSGLTLFEPEIGIFVITNARHAYVRRRFSGAHEYCHVLAEREEPGVVSRVGDNALIEVRANAFAASFLMPPDGALRLVENLGKSKSPGKRDLQLYDAAQLAHHFGVSRQSAIYQLKNVGLLSKSRLDELLDQNDREGSRVDRLLGLPKPNERQERRAFRHRFLGLAIEAWRGEEISRAKLHELANLVGAQSREVDDLLEGLGMDGEEGDEDVLIPEV